jgi:hypothetical protein
MSAPSSPGWILAATRRRASYADLRISDAERAEIADLLSRHYGDGRLDQALKDKDAERKRRGALDDACTVSPGSLTAVSLRSR